MPTNNPELIFPRLAAPFPQEEVKFRVGRSGKNHNGIFAMILAYIDARAAMDRLDAVVGPENWKDRYWREGAAVMCGVSIKVNGEWIEKVDGAEETDVEATKGGISDSFKRACVKWGLFRYGYNLGDSYAIITNKDDKEGHYAKTKEGEVFFWKPKPLPEWALPKSDDGGDAQSLLPGDGNKAPTGTPKYQFLKKLITEAKDEKELAQVWKINQATILMLGKFEQDLILDVKDAKKKSFAK